MGVLFEEHECAGEYETDEGRVDRVARENKAHANLRLITIVEHLGQARHLNLVLNLKQLLKDDAVCNHNEQAGQADYFQGEVVEAAHIYYRFLLFFF